MIQIDMEMPKSCAECPISRYQDTHDCPVIRTWSSAYREKRLDDCPLKEVPSGKWEQINKNGTNVIPQWKCSECGAEFKCFDMDFEYCPRCGAKMVEE